MGAQSVMAVGRTGRTHLRKAALTSGIDIGILRCHELVNIATEKADDAVLGVHGNAVSIGIGRGTTRSHAWAAR